MIENRRREDNIMAWLLWLLCQLHDRRARAATARDGKPRTLWFRGIPTQRAEVVPSRRG